MKIDVLAIALQTGLVLLLAPLVSGCIKNWKAKLQNRRGPRVWQPYFDIIKFLRKDMVISEHVSWVFSAAPYVVFVTSLLVGLMVPIVTVQAPLGLFGGALAIIGLLALGRFFLALGGLDPASAFGGMGSSREMTLSAIAEPALMLAIFTVAITAGSTDLSRIVAEAQGSNLKLLNPAHLMAFAALFIVLLAETGRVPVDNPATHLELTMIHEAMLLEYSGRYLTFMERSAAVEAFWPERNLGAMFYNTALEERLVWAAGGFTEVDDNNPNSLVLDSNWRAVGRVAGQPWWDEESKGRKFVHLGISGSYYEPRDGAHRFRSRPEAHLAPRFVDTGSIPADHSVLVGTEAALVYGPFSVQGEYFRNWVSATTTTGDSPSFDGYYLFGSWFITGESRAYRRATGAFDRLRPTNNFGLGEHSGAGAWELALRYSRVNLNDEGISGGRMHDYTAGVNWYLNPNMKIQFNYTLANLESDGLEGNTHIFQTRFATDF